LKHGLKNVEIVEGEAPEACETLPAPTHAFIGGSSGSLRDIVAALLEKNPDVRIVVNAITLETQSEAAACAKEFGFTVYETVSVQASRARKLGRYHMMTAQSPVSVITLQGGKLHA
jgi:precorrin-6Y C5,15-methyltransferase (decarboxylating)